MSDLWLQHVANGEAYSAENFLLPGGGMVANIQLFNPVASGKRLRLRSVNTSSTVNQGATVARHDTPLTTLGLPATFIVENMLAGGVAEVAEMRSQAAVAGIGALFWQLSAAAGMPAVYPPGGREWGFDLLEGQGIVVYGSVAVTVIANWQWVEVAL